MRRFLLLTLFTGYLNLLFAQFSFVGTNNTNTEFCPHPDWKTTTQQNGQGIYYFEMDFNGYTAGNYYIQTDGSGIAGNCRVITNITQSPNASSRGSFILAFEDQTAAVPQIIIKSRLSGSDFTTSFKFPKIHSYAGRTPEIWMNDNPINAPLCTFGSIIYNLVPLRFKNIDNGTEFGVATPYYEYSVPAGWTVDGIVSTGPENHIRAGISANIVVNELGGNVAKIRALPNTCQPLTLKPSEWATITLIRPEVKLTSGGANAVTIQCGTSVSKTFTLENANQASCITHYVWDLGSIDNGWQYGGAAAPQTITISGALNNSITLTSVCSKAPSNVSVTAFNGNKSLGTYTLKVTTNATLPSSTIEGSNNLCTSSPYKYFVSSLPCNATVNWSVDNPSAVSLTVNPDQSVSVTRIASSGSVVLSAEVSLPCGTAPKVSRTIKLGSNYLQQPYGTFTFETNAGSYQTVNLNTVVDFYGFTYSTNGLELRPSVTQPGMFGYWTMNEPVGVNYEVASFTSLNNTAIVKFNFYASSGNDVVSMQFNYFDGCSATRSNSHWFYYKGPNAGSLTTTMVVSPNPASRQVKVSLKGPRDGKTVQNIIEVRIIDKAGNVKKVEKYSQGMKEVIIDVSTLTTDIYIVEVTDGRARERLPISIKK